MLCCSIAVLGDSHIKWNKNNHSCTILNTDGSCMGSPIRAGCGGVFRNSAGYYLSGFSGYIQGSSDILHAELYAIYHGLLLTNKLGILELVCYSDSLLCVNLLKDPTTMFHVYAVLIQDVKDLMEQNNIIVCHTLREGNQYADFLAKLGAYSYYDLVHHTSPPGGLL